MKTARRAEALQARQSREPCGRPWPRWGLAHPEKSRREGRRSRGGSGKPSRVVLLPRCHFQTLPVMSLEGTSEGYAKRPVGFNRNSSPRGRRLSTASTPGRISDPFRMGVLAAPSRLLCAPLASSALVTDDPAASSGRPRGAGQALPRRSRRADRDVRQGPDGHPYLLTDSGDGQILRVIPSSR